VSIADLERVGRAAYESVGASPDDASFLTATNLDKAIQGDHARGIGKIPGLIAAARAGKLDMAPTVEIVREHGATCASSASTSRSTRHASSASAS
jgi:LDH2 family malate/lactate/ureidoglycolate dehydrogenase